MTYYESLPDFQTKQEKKERKTEIMKWWEDDMKYYRQVFTFLFIPVLDINGKNLYLGIAQRKTEIMQ